MKVDVVIVVVERCKNMTNWVIFHSNLDCGYHLSWFCQLAFSHTFSYPFFAYTLSNGANEHLNNLHGHSRFYKCNTLRSFPLFACIS